MEYKRVVAEVGQVNGTTGGAPTFLSTILTCTDCVALVRNQGWDTLVAAVLGASDA